MLGVVYVGKVMVSRAPWCLPLQARLKFPIDYPYSPPAFRFLTKMWHPNIYEVSQFWDYVWLGCPRGGVRGADPSLPCPADRGRVYLHPSSPSR